MTRRSNTTVSLGGAVWRVHPRAVPVVWLLGFPAMAVSFVVGIVLAIVIFVLVLPSVFAGILLGGKRER